MKQTKFFFWTLAIGLSSFMSTGFSQSTNLFTIKSNPNSYLTPSQLTHINAALNDNKIKSYKVVESIQSLRQQTHEMYVSLNNPIDFIIDNIHEPDSFLIKEWKGLNSDHDYCILVNKGELFSGYILGETEAWTLLPLGNDLALALEHDLDAESLLICGNEAEKAVSLSASPCDSPRDCFAKIDVLLLWTEDANAFINGFLPFGPFSTEELRSLYLWVMNSIMNTALRNSGIPNKEVVMHSRNFNGFIFDENPATPAGTRLVNDVTNLRNDGNAQAERNNARCDIVIMMTDQGYITPLGQAFGRVFDIDAADADSYAIVETPFALGGRQTLAHEIVHLFSARHNRNTNVPCNPAIFNCPGDDANICTHAFRFVDNLSVERRTALAITGFRAPGDAGARSLFFSNPNIQLNGTATGTIDDDNAKGINNISCRISTYRNSPQMSAQIGGTTILCGLGGVPFTGKYDALVTEAAQGILGHPPYTYEWRWNTTGLFVISDPVIGTSSSVTISNVLNCPEFFLRLRVTSSDGINTISTRRISTELCTECQSQPLISVHPPISSAKHILQESLEAHPNPFSSELNLILDLNADGGDVELTVLNSVGQVMYSEVIGNNLNKFVKKLPTSNWVSGVYIIEVSAKNLSFTRQIIKQ